MKTINYYPIKKELFEKISNNILNNLSNSVLNKLYVFTSVKNNEFENTIVSKTTLEQINAIAVAAFYFDKENNTSILNDKSDIITKIEMINKSKLKNKFKKILKNHLILESLDLKTYCEQKPLTIKKVNFDEYDFERYDLIYSLDDLLLHTKRKHNYNKSVRAKLLFVGQRYGNTYYTPISIELFNKLINMLYDENKNNYYNYIENGSPKLYF